MAKNTTTAGSQDGPREAKLVFPDFAWETESSLESACVATDTLSSSSVPAREIAKLHGGSYRVMAALRELADENGKVSCSKSELAAYMGACVRTVDYAMKDLRNAGFLQVTPTFADNGAQMENVYEILGDPGVGTERRGRPLKGTPKRSAPAQ